MDSPGINDAMKRKAMAIPILSDCLRRIEISTLGKAAVY